MAVITITARGYGVQIISGIPQLLSLDTNIPSNIYYTLNGTAPTTSSTLYIDPFELPLNGSVRVRALAISGADQGTLDVLFATDNTKLRYPRRSEATFGAGIVTDAYDQINVLTDGYGAGDDNIVDDPVRSSDYELVDLDIKFSRTGPNGIGEGTLITTEYTSVPKDEVISHTASSPNNNNVYFNPRSLYIIIDGRDGYEDQIYDGYRIIINPLLGTTDPVQYYDGRMLRENNGMATGGLVRSFYNAEKRLVVNYYRDSIEGRWIKSIQNYDPSAVPSGLGLRKSEGPYIVFKWIYNKRSAI